MPFNISGYAHSIDLNTLQLHGVALYIQLRRRANNNSKGLNERQSQACVFSVFSKISYLSGIWGSFHHYYASTVLSETNIIKFTHGEDGFCQVFHKN